MIKDKAGNMLYKKGDVMILDLLSEDRRRRIGVIPDLDKSVIVMRRDPNKHLLKVANAYGFCYEFLATAKKTKTVRLSILGKGIWNIPIKDILKHGDFLFFKKQGFEKQIFLTVEKLEKYGTKH